MNLKKFSIVLILFLALSGCKPEITNLPREEKKMITLEEAIEISRRELRKIDWPHVGEDLEVNVEDENTAWQRAKASRIQPPTTYDKKVKELYLKNRKFWVVGFGPKKLILGGVAAVFIDRSNGEILYIYLGQ